MDDRYKHVLDYRKNETWVERTERLGELLGYPKCCIDAFCKEDPLTRPDRKLHGSGYVPCCKCDNLSDGQLIDVINSNRKCDTKFPLSPWETP